MGTSPETIPASLERWLAYACPIVLLLAAAAFSAVFVDFGVTWDEGVQSTYGELVLDYFASAGQDGRCNEFSNLYYYGPLFESIAAALYRMGGAWKYEVRHAAIGLCGLLTLVAVWRFGRLFASSTTALFALLALVAMPRFIGHAFNNSKDIPFACAFAWAALGITRLLVLRRWRWRDVLLCGVTIGLALSVRVGAMSLFALLFAGVAWSLTRSPDERRAWRERGLERGIKLAAVVALAWGIMVSTWPWAHGGPLMRPFAALSEMSSFTFAYPTYFAGELVRSDLLPRHYLPLYLAIVTPLPILILAALGAVVAIRDSIVAKQRSMQSVMLLLWLIGPIAYVVAMRPNVYDGIRHFLFVLPALALLCGTCASWLCERTRGRRKWLLGGVLFVALVIPVRDLVSLHPYQSSYFNMLVGGVESAWRRYDTDYWASSYREAVRWVLDAVAERSDGPISIIVACNSANRPCAEYYLPSIEERYGEAPVTMHCVWEGNERLPSNARYYIGMLRYGKAAAFFPTWPVVHHVGRKGAVFSVIKRNPDSG